MSPSKAPHSIPGVSSGTRRALRFLYGALTKISPRLAAHFALALFSTPVCPEISAEERAVLRRASSRRLATNAGAVQIFQWEGAGRTILLVHGWSSRAARLSAFVDPLLHAGFRVVAFDAPAHGASAGRRTDIGRHIEALRAVLDACGPIHGIVAHSFGARTTLLALSNGGLPDVHAVALMGMPPDARYMLEQFKLVLGLRKDVRRLLNAGLVRTFGRPIDRHSPDRHARPIDVPVLIVHDVDDEVAPFDHAEALARQLPRAQVLATRDLGHCGCLRHPPLIRAIRNFLNETFHAPCRGTPVSEMGNTACYDGGGVEAHARSSVHEISTNT